MSDLSVDARRALGIAERCGVKYQWVHDEIDTSDTTYGPRGHYIHKPTQTVYFIASDYDFYGDQPEVLLHEVSHVYTQSPFWSIEDGAEDLILLQWERCVARSHFTRKGYQKVVAWQQDTESHHAGESLGNIKDRFGYDYRQTHWWRAGFLFLRKLGALTEDNRPTFKPLDWSIVGRQDALALLKCIEDGNLDDGRHVLDVVRALPSSGVLG